MHEMAVTQAFIDMVLEYAAGHRVTDIYLEVGRLSAVVPESVEVFFEYLSKGTLAEGARLHFRRLPIELTCMDCGQRMDLDECSDSAPLSILQRAFAEGCKCGSKNLRVTGGVSCALVSIDVEPTVGD
jgi:hydrogenase nickel incorporation protein HypA/HybF